MKYYSTGLLYLFTALFLPMALMADDSLRQADALYANGAKNLESYKQAGELYAKILATNSNNYEAAWKACAAYREYADQSQKKNLPDWKDISQKYGKIGFTYGRMAMDINPNGVEGNIWFGYAVYSYLQSVSVVTAIKEGLKPKTQNAMEKAYSIDKRYGNGMPVKGLGRFWFVLPWPLQNKDLSLKYFKEYHFISPNDPEGNAWYAETLLAFGKKSEAKILLQQTIASGDGFYTAYAKRLLMDM